MKKPHKTADKKEQPSNKKIDGMQFTRAVSEGKIERIPTKHNTQNHE